MRKIVITCDTGYVGMTSHEFYKVDSTLTDDQLDTLAWHCACENAESYGIYPRSDYIDSDEISDEEGESDTYSDNIEGYWEEYSPEEHDGHSFTGTPNWTKY